MIRADALIRLDTKIVERLLGKPARSEENIGKGKNSRLFMIETGSGVRYAVKNYFGRTMDGRNRAEAEFSALSFLWKNGVRDIPEPVAVDNENNVAIYNYIDGIEINSAGAGPGDIDQLIEFLARLKSLTVAEGSNEIYPASEACFSPEEITINIEGRLRRLQSSSDDSRLTEFLHNEFKPAFGDIANWAKGGITRESITASQKTLSPSDFGLHNALRVTDGRIVFVDFEYFGWDDPAKLTSDFLLHPAMSLDLDLKERFVKGAVELFGNDSAFTARLKIVYPLYALKWVMILLNEFVPEHLERLELSAKDERIINMQEQQMQKAVAMLRKATDSRDIFPYEI